MIMVSVSRRNDMKRVFRILCSAVFAVILLFAGAMAYSTAKGYMRWYFRVNGYITVDGHTTTGYMHANTQRTLLMVTRTDGSRPESYLVYLRDESVVLDCGEWHPVRLLPFPVGHVSPPCSAFTVDSEKVVDAPVPKTLVRERRSVEFLTASGKRVKAEW